MKLSVVAVVGVVAAALAGNANGDDALLGNVPGRPTSVHFAAFVFQSDAETNEQRGPRAVPVAAGSVSSSRSSRIGIADEPWLPVYVYQTTAVNATAAGVAGCGYFDHLNNWTANWVSLVRRGSEDARSKLWPVVLKVRRLQNSAVGNVTAARIHPKSSGVSVVSVLPNGDVVVNVPAPAHFSVDFSPGGFDDVNTGPAYKYDGRGNGLPMHSFHVFASEEHPGDVPITNGSDPSVLVVRPGDPLPTAATAASLKGAASSTEHASSFRRTRRNGTNFTTVYLAPGVHQVPRDPNTGWRIYQLLPNVRYYLDPAAVLHSRLDRIA